MVTEDRFEALAKLQPGWDSYGSEVPTETALHHAQTFLAALEYFNIASVSICPTAEGGVALEWSDDEHTLIVDFLPDGRPAMYVQADDFEWETS